MRARNLSIPVLAVMLLMPAARAAAESSSLELWMNMMVEWQVSRPLLLTFDLEPEVLLAGPGQWESISLTTSADYAVTKWLDLMAEGLGGYTVDTDNPNTSEVTERLGLRLYIIRSRFQLRDTFRFEQRNRFYSDGSADHVFRTRNRIEARYVVNRERSSEAGAVILLADFEYFIPIHHDPHERYASRYRIRAGVGYRLNVDWRFDLMYMYQRSRNTYDAPFTNAEHIIDLRFRRAF